MYVEAALSLVVYTAGVPDMGSLQSSVYSETSFSSPATEAAATFVSPANRAPPVATVMPLNSSMSIPSAPSVQPTAQWSEKTAEPGLGSQQVSVPPGGSTAYFPVAVHWFYCRNIELRQIWQPFSVMDSANLESAHQSIVSGKISSSLIIFFYFLKF